MPELSDVTKSSTYGPKSESHEVTFQHPQFPTNLLRRALLILELTTKSDQQSFLTAVKNAIDDSPESYASESNWHNLLLDLTESSTILPPAVQWHLLNGTRTETEIFDDFFVMGRCGFGKESWDDQRTRLWSALNGAVKAVFRIMKLSGKYGSQRSILWGELQKMELVTGLLKIE